MTRLGLDLSTAPVDGRYVLAAFALFAAVVLALAYFFERKWDRQEDEDVQDAGVAEQTGQGVDDASGVTGEPEPGDGAQVAASSGGGLGASDGATEPAGLNVPWWAASLDGQAHPAAGELWPLSEQAAGAAAPSRALDSADGSPAGDQPATGDPVALAAGDDRHPLGAEVSDAGDVAASRGEAEIPGEDEDEVPGEDAEEGLPGDGAADAALAWPWQRGGDAAAPSTSAQGAGDTDPAAEPTEDITDGSDLAGSDTGEGATELRAGLPVAHLADSGEPSERAASQPLEAAAQATQNGADDTAAEVRVGEVRAEDGTGSPPRLADEAGVPDVDAEETKGFLGAAPGQDALTRTGELVEHDAVTLSVQTPPAVHVTDLGAVDQGTVGTDGAGMAERAELEGGEPETAVEVEVAGAEALRPAAGINFVENTSDVDAAEAADAEVADAEVADGEGADGEAGATSGPADDGIVAGPERRGGLTRRWGERRQSRAQARREQAERAAAAAQQRAEQVRVREEQKAAERRAQIEADAARAEQERAEQAERKLAAQAAKLASRQAAESSKTSARAQRQAAKQAAERAKADTKAAARQASIDARAQEEAAKQAAKQAAAQAAEQARQAKELAEQRRRDERAEQARRAAEAREQAALEKARVEAEQRAAKEAAQAEAEAAKAAETERKRAAADADRLARQVAEERKRAEREAEAEARRQERLSAQKARAEQRAAKSEEREAARQTRRVEREAKAEAARKAAARRRVERDQKEIMRRASKLNLAAEDRVAQVAKPAKGGYQWSIESGYNTDWVPTVDPADYDLPEPLPEPAHLKVTP